VGIFEECQNNYLIKKMSEKKAAFIQCVSGFSKD